MLHSFQLNTLISLFFLSTYLSISKEVKAWFAQFKSMRSQA